eukprot:TRINITY_DN9929_c0_g1_i1.p1 TRINITY_DN9929_c0_g1~~TRINITY_DN9929_c0_g1_i1.p1  ORF type:complete len:537 (-),score=53.94 TRINITY_DN9929_c0_g1_i1:79-1689(-)
MDIWQAAAVDDAITVERLLSQGLCVNSRQPGTGRTPMHCAAQNMAARCIELLLDRRASLAQDDESGHGPLDFSNRAAEFILATLHQPPPWVQDASAALCQDCRTTRFSVLHRRHHCRHCGRLLCSRCSHYRVAIPVFGYRNNVRVCRLCHSVILKYGKWQLASTGASPPATPAPASKPAINAAEFEPPTATQPTRVVGRANRSPSKRKLSELSDNTSSSGPQCKVSRRALGQVATRPCNTTTESGQDDSFSSSEGEGSDNSCPSTTDYFDEQRRLYRRSNTVLGCGAAGIVYQGLHCGKLVAIKEVALQNETRDAEVAREVRFLASIGPHPNVVRFIASFPYTSRDGRRKLVIVMEHAKESVGSLLQRYGRFDSNTIRKYTGDILKGLEFLHTRDIVHRDLKPFNVLIDVDGSARISDFGTCATISTLKTQDGRHMAGTPMYMAPEQMRGNPVFSSDVWSVGGTVLEMATGQRPYAELRLTSPLQYFIKVGQEQLAPAIPRDVPEAITLFVRKCMQPDAPNRPSCSELLRDSFIVS